MQITVLVDNNTFIDRYFLGEPGLSYLIETGDVRVLWDTGYSDVFIRNGMKKGISFRDLDYVAISHAHLDHSWGFDALIKLFTEMQFERIPYKRPRLLMHPDIFLSRTFEGGDEFGLMVQREVLERYFDPIITREPYWITEDLVYLGEVARLNDFEALQPIGKVWKNERWQDDYILDDSALAYRSSDCLVIITGCSHAGICNIIEQGKRLLKVENVRDVIGGFHLQDPSAQQLEGTLAYIQQLEPAELHACHCTDLNSKIALARVANIKEVGAGMVMDYSPS